MRRETCSSKKQKQIKLNVLLQTLSQKGTTKTKSVQKSKNK